VYVVVVGGGKVGYHLTKSLLSEGQEVLVVEKDASKASRMTRELGATVIHGDGAEVATLTEAGVERADVVAAVTGHDEDNLIIAQVAKRRFDVPRTVARINNPRNEYIFEKLGIDATVSATQVILSVIQQAMPAHAFVHLLTLQEGGVEFVELHLQRSALAVGKAMRDMALPPDTAIPLLIRAGGPVFIQPDTELQEDDRLFALTTSEQEATLRLEFVGE
jgi:trk system potassium uptake protein TrkA